MDEFGEIYRTLFPQVYRYLLALVPGSGVGGGADPGMTFLGDPAY